MSNTMIDVDKQKWNSFKKWCINNDTTMKSQLDKLLSKFLKEVGKHD